MNERLDRDHGSPYDRGGADSWYRRPPKPHFYAGPTGMSERFEEDQMTEEQIREYWRGYEDNEAAGDHKDWG